MPYMILTVEDNNFSINIQFMYWSIKNIVLLSLNSNKNIKLYILYYIMLYLLYYYKSYINY